MGGDASRRVKNMWKNISLFSPVLLVIAYSVCIFSPYIMLYELLTPLIIGAAFVLVTTGKLIYTKEKLFRVFFAFLLLSFIYKISGYSTGDIGNYGNRLSWFFAVWMAFYMWQYRTRQECTLVFIVTSIVFLSNLIYTAYFHIMFPDFNAVLQTNDDSIYQYGRVNIGFTNVTIAAMFYAIFLLLYIKTKGINIRKRLYGILWLIEILLLYYIVFWGDSTTTTLALIVSVLFIVFNRGISIIVCIFLLLIYNVFQTEIVSFCREYINDRLADRLVAMSNISSAKMSNDDKRILSRIPMLVLDIKMWFSSITSFLFGNGFHSNVTGDVMTDAIRNRAGGHSAIFDSISRYGLIGFTLVIMLCKELRLWLEKNLCNKKFATIVLLVIIFNNVFNDTIAPNVLFVICFCYPFLRNEISNY